MTTQRYTIYRKMPMLARQERTLAIDGVYVHVSPADREWPAISSCLHTKDHAFCKQGQGSL
jgi:hypothetical protein